jgi:hypothetical protein
MSQNNAEARAEANDSEVASIAPKKGKNETFRRLAKGRVEKVIDALRILGHCSNKSSYEYSDKEVDKMFAAIDKAKEDCLQKFKEKQDQQKGFEFD